MIVNQFQELGQPVVTTQDFYRLGNKLGQGAFGKVSIAQHKLTGHFVAVKSLPKKDLDKEVECRRRVSQEMQILQLLTNQRNVVKLYDSFETSSHLCFVMELCAGGDLLSYVRRRKKLDETVAKYLFKQAAKSLAYCHSNLVLHRDIKLENLLLDEEGTIKLCDFGVSRQLKKEEELLSEQCGTPAYMAPEVHAAKGKIKGKPTDIWSLGVCLYAMLVGMVPFRGKTIEELQELIIKGEFTFPSSADGLSKQAKKLIQGMLERDPDKRLDANQVVKHPWLKGCQKKMKIYSQSELKKIKTLSQPTNGGDEPQRLLTEVALTEDNKVSAHSPEKPIVENFDDIHSIPQTSQNIEAKSVILAPFNTTLSEKNWQPEEGVEIEEAQVIKFSDKAREANRQYEYNYNEEVDNGVMISQSDQLNSLSEALSQQAESKASQGQSQGLINKRAKLNPLESSDSNEKQVQPPSTQGPGVSKAPSSPAIRHLGNKVQKVSLATESNEQKSRNTQQTKQTRDSPVVNHVINFNIGGLDLKFDKHEQTNTNEKQTNSDIQQASKEEEAVEASSEEESEEAIDMLIVCKIENEFGYPEQYITSCLKKGIKNDATTCYYLFLKEDKHEIVNLLSESPMQPAIRDINRNSPESHY